MLWQSQRARSRPLPIGIPQRYGYPITCNIWGEGKWLNGALTGPQGADGREWQASEFWGKWMRLREVE